MVTNAVAADGRIEINHASALQGVALGDLPGYPVTLTLRGSYVLTGELNVPADTTGIVLQNDQIDLDLNGFSVVGGGGTTGFGIYSPVQTTRGQRVSGGTIRSFAQGGVRLGRESHVEDVVVIGSGMIGINVGDFSHVRGCTANDNGSHGILADRGSRVTASIASSNGNDGIRVLDGLIARNIAHDNDDSGIRALGATPVLHNSASSNGIQGVTANSGPVLGNTLAQNTSEGLSLPPSGGFAQNVIYGNNAGADQTSLSIELGPNVCEADTTCP